MSAAAAVGCAACTRASVSELHYQVRQNSLGGLLEDAPKDRKSRKIEQITSNIEGIFLNLPRTALLSTVHVRIVMVREHTNSNEKSKR